MCKVSGKVPSAHVGNCVPKLLHFDWPTQISVSDSVRTPKVTVGNLTDTGIIRHRLSVITLLTITLRIFLIFSTSIIESGHDILRGRLVGHTMVWFIAEDLEPRTSLRSIWSSLLPPTNFLPKVLERPREKEICSSSFFLLYTTNLEQHYSYYHCRCSLFRFILLSILVGNEWNKEIT
jgi:hypothetical protein